METDVEEAELPQIWLRYDEMAEAFGGTAREARQGAIDAGHPRVKGRDGIAHVLLTPALAHQYLCFLMRGSAGTAYNPGHMISALGAVLGQPTVQNRHNSPLDTSRAA